MHVRVVTKAEKYRKFRRHSAHRKEIVRRAKTAFEERRAEQLRRIEEKEHHRVQRIRFEKERSLIIGAQQLVLKMLAHGKAVRAFSRALAQHRAEVAYIESQNEFATKIQRNFRSNYNVMMARRFRKVGSFIRDREWSIRLVLHVAATFR